MSDTYCFSSFGWRRLFSWFWRHKFVAPDARGFLLRSEACLAEVVFSLAPELVQVLFEGRMPVWPKVLALMPGFGQVFVKGRRPLWPKENFALMPDFGQVFVKVEGLFSHKGRFKLPLPMAGALKGPLVFVYRILRRQS